MKILITGASGTVGQKVLEQLCEDNKHEVIAFDIKNKKTQKFYKRYQDSIDIRYGDLANKKDVIPVCHDVDIAIHLGAIIPPLADENPSLAHEVNVNGTQNLIRSLELHSYNAFLLYASSVSVYGDRIKNPCIRIGDTLLPSDGDEYAKTKIKAENLIQESKLDWSIFRLSAIIGINNHKISGLMFHMPLSTPMEITTPEDTASAFVNAIEKRALLNNRIFNLGGGASCRTNYREFLTKSFSISGLGPLNFPKYAFAEKNFHCGFYTDGDELEEILRFRNDTMETYFIKLENATSSVTRLATRLLNGRIKKHLMKKSEPFKAYEENDKALLQRYFDPSLN